MSSCGVLILSILMPVNVLGDARIFTHIIHLADIHIRNDVSRKEEYVIVMDNLYKRISECGHLTPEQTMIVICGDLLHDARKDKGKILSNAIDVSKRLFKNLEKYGTVVIIPGNHDNNITYQHKLDYTITDALSSIIQGDSNLGKSVFYLKDTGVYALGNCLLYHTSVFDIDRISSSRDYSKRRELLINRITGSEYEQYHHVSLLHCGVETNRTKSNYILKNYGYKLEDLEQYDLGLLGDTHHHQFLNARRTIAYPSSLIQQNFGESILNHGFIVWCLDNYVGRHYHVENPYGFITVHNGAPDSIIEQLDTEDTSIVLFKDVDSFVFPLYTRVKLKIYEELSQSNIDDCRNKIEGKCNLIKFVVDKNFSIYSQDDNVDIYKQINDIDALTAYLDTIGTSDIPSEKIIAKHTEMVGLLGEHKITNSKIYWTKIVIENFRGYVGSHELNLTKYDTGSSISINGNNKEGKSTILEALIFGAWGYKGTGNSLASYINTSNDHRPSVSVYFTHNGKQKRITRTIAKNGKHEKVSLAELNEDLRDGGGWMNKTTTKKETELDIGRILGTRDNATNTFISQQEHHSNFIRSPKTELISELLNCNMYDSLTNPVRSDIKRHMKKQSELNGIISQLNVDILDETRVATIEERLATHRELIAKHTQELGDISGQIHENERIYKKFEYMKEGDLQKLVETKDNYLELVLTLKKSIKAFEVPDMSGTSEVEYINKITTLKEKLILTREYKETSIKSLHCTDASLDVATLSAEHSVLIGELESKDNLIYVTQSNIETVRKTRQALGIQSDCQLDLIVSRNIVYLKKRRSLDKVLYSIQSAKDKLKDIRCELEELGQHWTFNDGCVDCSSNNCNLTKKLDESLELHKAKLYEKQQEKSTLDEEIAELERYHLLAKQIEQWKDSNQKESLLESEIHKIGAEKKVVELRLDTNLKKQHMHGANLELITLNIAINAEITAFEKQISSYELDIKELNIERERKMIQLRTIKDNESNILQLRLKTTEVKAMVDTLELQYSYKRIMSSIQVLHGRKLVIEDTMSKLTNAIHQFESALSRSVSAVSEKETHAKELIHAAEELSILNVYKNIIDTTGFPNYLINQTLPILSRNMNMIIYKMGFDFTCALAVPDNKTLKSKNRSLEIEYIKNSISFKPSGSEVFAASMAFRISISKITKINSSNIFIIDEGFGSLDATRRESLDNIFTYLKTEFEYLIYISHIESIKNKADYCITVSNFTIH